MKLLRDPLVHFLLLGAALFGLFGLVSDDAPDADAMQIVVTQNEIDQLGALFTKQWNRPPTDEELEALVEGHIREQVFYREALALGLDRDDTIIRRRMVQKMEFIVSDVSVPRDPPEEALRSWYEENIDRYMQPTRLSFSHVYFNPDRRGEKVEADAQLSLESLLDGQAGGAGGDAHGDRFMLEYHYTDVSVDDIARNFGKSFAEAIEEVPTGQWHGPVLSGFGLHLVYVEASEAASPLEFARVRNRVQADYLFDLNKRANEAVYEKLKERYEILVEGRDA